VVTSDPPLAPVRPHICTDSPAALFREGKYSEAIPLARQLLEIREAQFGPNHPGVVYAINRLALAYQEQDRFRDAEPLYRRALAIRENVLGHDSPEVAGSLARLGRLYLLQDRNADAECCLHCAPALEVRHRLR
jgi:tetratricopeptide (TPR) repeat protein